MIYAILFTASVLCLTGSVLCMLQEVCYVFAGCVLRLSQELQYDFKGRCSYMFYRKHAVFLQGVCYACRHEDDWTDTGSSDDFEVD